MAFKMMINIDDKITLSEKSPKNKNVLKMKRLNQSTIYIHLSNLHSDETSVI